MYFSGRHSVCTCKDSKYSKCKNQLEKFSPQFFGIKTVSSALIIFQKAKLSTRSITHLCWCNWRIFWTKNAAWREGHQVGPVLARQCPGSPGTYNPKKLAYLVFQCLDHPPYSPDLAPSDYHLFPGLKEQLKCRHFSSDSEVIAAAETWLDEQHSEFFLSSLQKLQQWAKKCTELRGEYVE